MASSGNKPSPRATSSGSGPAPARAGSASVAGRLGWLTVLLLAAAAVGGGTYRERILQWRYRQLPTSALLTRAQGSDPGPVLLAVAGERLLAEGRGPETRALLDPVVDRSTTNVALDVLAARAAWLTGEPQRTGALLDAALKVDPGSLDARYWSAELVYSRGNRELAERIMQEIVAVDPGRADVWQRLGEISLQAQEYEKALDRLDRAERTRPTGRVAQLRAETLERLGREPEAEAAARAAVARKPDAESYSRLGEILQQSGGDDHLREAGDCMRKAVSLDPHRTDTWKQLVAIERSQGNDAEAVRVLRSMLRSNPYLPEGYLTLSQCYRALGKSSLAEATLRIFRQLEPFQAKVEWAKHRVIIEHGALTAQLTEARALLALGQREAATQVVARASAKAPDDPRVQALARACREPVAVHIDPLPPDSDSDGNQTASP